MFDNRARPGLAFHDNDAAISNEPEVRTQRARSGFGQVVTEFERVCGLLLSGDFILIDAFPAALERFIEQRWTIWADVERITLLERKIQPRPAQVLQQFNPTCND